MSEKAKLTIPDLAAKKAAGERLVMVAVGEALTAAWAERARVDIVGVGDSLGMKLHGHENTLATTAFLPNRFTLCKLHITDQFLPNTTSAGHSNGRRLVQARVNRLQQ